MTPDSTTMRRFVPLAGVASATLVLGFLTGLGASRRMPWPASPGEAPAGPPLFTTGSTSASATRAAAAIDGALTEVARGVMPAVVNISSTRVIRSREIPSPFFGDPFFRHFFGDDLFRQFQIPRERREQSLGSGVIVTGDGYVMTNNHVIAAADEVRVTLNDRREFEARVVGTDPKTDLAVLKLDGRDLPHLPLGDSDRTEVGEIVLAVGNPFGLSQTVTMGIISAKGRANVGIADYEDFIQTDAAINPGNSGGALVNGRGELIGINTAIASRTGGYQGIGFAIPSNMARGVSEELIRHGKVTRGYLGVVIQEVTPALAEAFGLKEARGAPIGDAAPASPAARGGLRRGDVVVEYDGQQVEDWSQLRLRVSRTPVGRSVRLVVLRDGKRAPLEVTVGELEEEEPGGAPSAGEPAHGSLEGVEVQDLTPAVARRLGLPRGARGVVVTDVQPGSRAAESGLQPGDLIREVNREAVTSAAGFRAALRTARGETLVLLVQRRDNTLYLTVR